MPLSVCRCRKIWHWDCLNIHTFVHLWMLLYHMRSEQHCQINHFKKGTYILLQSVCVRTEWDCCGCRLLGWSLVNVCPVLYAVFKHDKSLGIEFEPIVCYVFVSVWDLNSVMSVLLRVEVRQVGILCLKLAVCRANTGNCCIWCFWQIQTATPYWQFHPFSHLVSC